MNLNSVHTAAEKIELETLTFDNYASAPSVFSFFLGPFVTKSNNDCMFIFYSITSGTSNPAERLVWISTDAISFILEVVVQET